MNWKAALALRVIPQSGWMSRMKAWRSGVGSSSPPMKSMEVLRAGSPWRKWGQDM